MSDTDRFFDPEGTHTHLYGSTVFSPPLDGGWEDVGGLETSLTTAKVGRVKEHTCLDASAVRSGPETAEHASKRDVLYSVRVSTCNMASWARNILMDFLTLERGYEILNFSED
jgi:hypothetical protein